MKEHLGKHIYIYIYRYKVKDKGLKRLRLKTRTEQYVQNRMFQTSQAKLFQRSEKENRNNNTRPESQECVILE